MIIDLFHNKIVKETATDGFVESFHSVLVPMLTEKYGEGLEAVTMYEDHLGDDFLVDGEWYYPLSLKLVGEETIICWIKWPVNKKTFRNNVPYAYVGTESVEFSFAGFVPAELADSLKGRAIDYDRSAIKISVEALTDDPMLLVGKYSQTFVDELSRQITRDISETLGVSGFENTTMELQLVFAPGTYLEHTSESVTYRRLLLVEKGCQARDFWVKWTRLDGQGGFRTSDHVSADTVEFRIGEDASQKIREKEYRFLAGANPNKYQSAMGKKTVTEWRDIIKRAVKREELVKIPAKAEVADHASEVYDRFAAIQSAMATAPKAEAHVPVVEPAAPVDPYDVVAALSAQLSAPVPETENTSADDDIAALVRATLGVTETKAPVEEPAFEVELVESEEEISEAPQFEVEIVEVDETEDDGAELEVEVEIELGSDEQTDEQTDEQGEIFAIAGESTQLDFSEVEPESETFSMGDVTFEEYERVAAESRAAEPAVDTDALLREREAQLRLEYETEARQRAEREAERLRLEQERLIAENARLLQLAREEENRRMREAEARRLEEEERQRALAAKRAEEERQRAELEARKRLEEQERARFAETARMVVEEQKRVEAERQAKAERERQEALARESERLRREEEERRLDEERRRAEQRAREEERLRREEEERKRREAEAARARVESVEKRVHLIFRYNFDPNIVPRIKEITDTTIRELGKSDVDMHIRAFPGDANSIILQVKLPSNEMDLLVSIVKAIGNARIGVIKVSIE